MFQSLFFGLRDVGPALIWLEPVSKACQVVEQDVDAGELGEAVEGVDEVSLSDEEPFVVAQPGERPFDLPAVAVAAELAAVLGGWSLPPGTMRADKFDPLLGQPLSQGAELPTPEQIRSACLEIQATWSAWERHVRDVVKSSRFPPVACTSPPSCGCGAGPEPRVRHWIRLYVARLA